MRDCPENRQNESKICYHCGSLEHSIKDCHVPHQGGMICRVCDRKWKRSQIYLLIISRSIVELCDLFRLQKAGPSFGTMSRSSFKIQYEYWRM